MGDHTLIEDGLAIGDTVVVEGAFALKAQLLKAQLGEGHGH
jgi:cobalt-zinc-cadmium efflux system membrane fusion protein